MFFGIFCALIVHYFVFLPLSKMCGVEYTHFILSTQYLYALYFVSESQEVFAFMLMHQMLFLSRTKEYREV